MKKKRYIVVPRTDAVKKKGIATGKGRLTFGNKSAQWVDDPAIANEINTTHGLKGSGDVWVEQDENLEWHERNDGMTDGRNSGIHNYTFANMGANLPDRMMLVGKKKTINGFLYMYTMRDNKLKLEPYKERRKRAGKREAQHGLAPDQ